MNVYLELHASAGPEVNDVVADACKVSQRLMVPVQIDINRITTIIYPNDNPDRVLRGWNHAYTMKLPVAKAEK